MASSSSSSSSSSSLSSSSSPLRSKEKLALKARSVSLTSRSSPHPIISQFNDHLQRQVDPTATINPYSSLSSMSETLKNLESVYDCIDDVLSLTQSRQLFARECQEKWVDQTLDGYLRLLDSCTATKDSLSNTRENLQQMVSILRRKKDGEDDICGLLISRKKAKKVIRKIIKEVKNIRTKPTTLVQEKDSETLAVIGVLREVECGTLEVLESLLSYILGTKERRWNLFTKLMMQSSKKGVSAFNGQKESEGLEMNKFEKMDCALVLLVEKKMSKFGNHESLQNQLREMEIGIEVVEEGLECLFKCLIRTRVSLLNLVNH